MPLIPSKCGIMKVIEPRQLVNAEGLLDALFPNPKSRPSLRFIRQLQADRRIPYKKVGRLVYFDPIEVREALDRNCTVKAAR